MNINVAQSGQDYIFKHLIDEERACVLSKLKQLERALMGLHYEGKIFSFNHIKKIEDIVSSLRKKYQQHANLDEKVVYPFLEKHIPRISPTLNFLEMECQQFQGLFEAFDKVLSELKEKNRIFLRNNIIEQLKNKGIYLICLVKSHIQLEEEIVYKAIFQELHKNERGFLQKEIEIFTKNNRK